MPAEGSPFSGTTRVLGVDVPPARERDVIEGLRELAGRLPFHPAILPISASGVANGRAFIITPEIAGESLDEALHLYGPAAAADALPRLQQLADALDLAAGQGLCHGALTQADILVTADATYVVGIGVAATLADAGIPMSTAGPYSAPELSERGELSPRADQYALAIIAYEWLFGRPFDERESMAPADVDRQRLELALATATARDPERRFADCRSFVAALGDSLEPREPAAAHVFEFATRVAELPLNTNTPNVAVTVTRTAPGGYGLAALAAVLVIGVLVGALGMWFAGRGGSSIGASMPDSSTAQAERSAAPENTPREVTEGNLNPPPDEVSALRPGPATIAHAGQPDAAPAAQLEAGLLVHSTPAGAAVVIDGVARGTTPVAVRDLDLGTRSVVVSRAGYHAVERQVLLTADRPSRTLEIELTPLRPAMLRAPRPTDGTVLFESRPPGATVIVDGRVAGVTPLTMTLAPGSHTIRMEHAGYRAVDTRVDVGAGERTRVAARLEGGRYEE